MEGLSNLWRSSKIGLCSMFSVSSKVGPCSNVSLSSKIGLSSKVGPCSNGSLSSKVSLSSKNRTNELKAKRIKTMAAAQATIRLSKATIGMRVSTTTAESHSSTRVGRHMSGPTTRD